MNRQVQQIAGSLVVIALGVVASVAAVPASGATWMGGGADVSTTRTATVVGTIQPLVLFTTTESAKFECTTVSGEEVHHPPEAGGQLRVLSTFSMSGCSVKKPAGCTMPTTLAFMPLEGEPTLLGSLLSVGLTLKPKSGTTIANVSFAGEGCSAAGRKPITGDFETDMINGRRELTVQSEEFDEEAVTGLLKFAGEATDVTDKTLLKLTTGEAWSFL